MKSKKATLAKEIDEAPNGAIINRDTPANREQMIAYAAYFRAERRGFTSGQDQADWLESEREVDSHINSFTS